MNMKNKFTYLLPLLLIFVIACTKNKTAPTPLPSGTFSGVFVRLHLNKNNSIDTAKANIVLSMETATGYAVTGDTTSVQAGSFGNYIFGTSGTNNLVQFFDKTYPATGTPVKTHLVGVYQYFYDGTNLQLLANTDSLGYQYTLKKTGN
jgi:hypothetical protein